MTSNFNNIDFLQSNYQRKIILLLLAAAGMTTAAYADQKISLNDTNSSLNQVVVTAMGIKRDRKALEYATKAVKPFLLLFFFYINN